MSTAQSLFFETMFLTAIRYESIINLTLADIKKVKDTSTGRMVYTINVEEKRKKVVKAITDSFYNKLFEISENGEMS